MRDFEFVNLTPMKRHCLALLALSVTAFSLSLFNYFSFKDLFGNLQPSKAFSIILILTIFFVSLFSVISTMIQARIKRTTLKFAFYEDSISFSSSIIIVLLIPLVALYSNHTAVDGYAKPFFLCVWLLSCICLKILVSISDQNLKRLFDWTDRNITIVLTVLLSSYILILFALAKIKYINFGGYMTDDAHFMQFFNYANKGYFLKKTVLGDTILGVHLSFILYFLLIPYFIYPNINTILLLKTSMIGLSGIPLYLIIRKRHNCFLTILILLSYLLFHQIAGANVIDFHEVVFAPFFLLFAYYFFEERKFYWFFAFLVLSLFVKENVAFVVCVFGLYAIYLKRGKEWIVTPLIMSGGWLFLSLKILLPFFSSSKSLSAVHAGAMSRIFEIFGGSYRQFFHLVNERWMGLIYALLQPVLFFVPFLSIEFLFVVPWLMMKIMVGGNPQIRTWHFLIVSGFLYIAFANSLHKICSIVRYKRFNLVVVVIALSVSISCLPYWFRPEEYVAKSYWSAQREVVELIPMEGSVCAPEYILSYLADRREIYNEVSFQKELRDDIDFIIFDSNIKHYRIDWQDREIVPKFIRDLRKLAPLKKSYLNYNYYWERDGIFIYKNRRFEFTECRQFQ